MAKIVQRFICHAASHGTITNDGNNVAEVVGTCIASNCETVCIRQHSGGVTVLNEVVTTLFAAGVSRDTAVLTQLAETRLTTRENLVHVCLVPGVPQDGVGGGFKNTVQRNGQLDCSEV